MSTNAWSKFRELLPASTTLIVEVIEHNADGTSTVELASGDQFVVRGQSVAEGDWAYVRDGEIRGEAPPGPAVVELLV